MDNPHEIPLDQFELLGLKKEKSGNRSFYTLTFTDKQPSSETIAQLRELLLPHRVAVEVGPGDQLDSLLFASQKANADVVIGIDPFFDFKKIKQPTKSGVEDNTTLILIKGDTWGNFKMKELFGDSKKPKLAVYSQLISPDTMIAKRMIDEVRGLTRGGFMIVLDPRSVSALKEGVEPLGWVETEILKERGVEKPNSLDWISMIQLKGVVPEKIDSSQYEKNMQADIYPTTSFLGKGDMLIWEKPVPQ